MLQSRYEQTFAAQADKGTPFLRFWHSVNNILKSRGLPKMLYGEARDWFNEQQYFSDACGSVQCPHCRWGFARAVIAQHVREKHCQAV